jgi:hypothetical protein
MAEDPASMDGKGGPFALRFEVIVPNPDLQYSEEACRQIAEAALEARGLVPVGTPTVMKIHVDGSAIAAEAWSYSWSQLRPVQLP